MPAANPDELISAFQRELDNLTIPVIDLVRGRIGHGTPYIFYGDDAGYFRFKQRVANNFEVHPDKVKIVGSAHLGFSIAPRKLWSPFNQESDVDVVVVDTDCFMTFWRDLLRHNLEIKARSERDEEKYRKFLQYHFRGWIRPDLLPPEYSRPWFDFYRSLYASFEGRRVAGALYYSEEFFETYHLQNLSELRAARLR